MKMIFLVDGDNNIGTGLQGVEYLTPEDTVLIFYQKTGLALSKIQELCRGSRANIQYLESVKGGRNSIDFQIITELGVLIGRGEADYAYVISQDRGYEAAMSVLQARHASTFREVALRPSIASCLRAFSLRAGSLEELEAALEREYGAAQGAMVYRHLTKLFSQAPQEPAEAPVKRTGRRRRGKASQEPARKAAELTAAAESPEVPPAAEKEDSEAKPAKAAKKTRSRRGRLSRKPAADTQNG